MSYLEIKTKRGWKIVAKHSDTEYLKTIRDKHFTRGSYRIRTAAK